MIVGFGYVLNTITNIYLGALNGMGKPSISMLLMIIYYIAVRMPLAFILSSFTPLGLSGIWLAVLISHIIACLVATITGIHRIRFLSI